MQQLPGESLEDAYRRTNAWGLDTGIDLHGCDEYAIQNAGSIKEFVIALCEKIQMKRFGECIVVNFGEDEKVAGYSMTQLIETSLISAHFANASRAAYIDVFSCKFYNPADVADFAKEWFGAESVGVHVALRV